MSTLIWDYFIISYLAASGIFLAMTVKTLKRTWKKDKLPIRRLKIAIATFFVVSILTLLYGSLVAPRLIQIKNVGINLGKTTNAESVRVVQISDLHAGTYKGEYYWKGVAKKIRALNPDIIIMTGDYIYGSEKNAEKLKPVLSLGKIFPTYAVTGNHEYNLGSSRKADYDHYKDKTATLRRLMLENNVTLLDNEGVIINTAEGQLSLSGIKEVWTQTATINDELNRLFLQTTPSMPSILLAHNPEVINYSGAANFGLILSGHTHGGQIRLPFLGSISPMPDNLGRKYDRGHFDLPTGNQLYINQGLGEAGPRARLFCPPEITLLSVNL
jgi:predicted MPP superfamily phosphohydrolase